MLLSQRSWRSGTASPRRIGGPDAKNRTVLLDAAERLMPEEGYAAVTSRQVARRAGLSGGHAETVEFIKRQIERPQQGDATLLTRNTADARTR